MQIRDNLHGMSNPAETIFMKCKNLFSGLIRENTSKCHLLKILYRVLSLKTFNCQNAFIVVLKYKASGNKIILENTKLSKLKLFYQKKKK